MSGKKTNDDGSRLFPPVVALMFGEAKKTAALLEVQVSGGANGTRMRQMIRIKTDDGGDEEEVTQHLLFFWLKTVTL